MHHRWMIAFGFGLVHGFGFSFALRETLQFAGAHMLTSLLSFNIGVELGQLLVLVLLIPVLDLLFRTWSPERMGTIILSALVAHTAWHWMIDRWAVCSQFRIQMPAVQRRIFRDAAPLGHGNRGDRRRAVGDFGIRKQPPRQIRARVNPSCLGTQLDYASRQSSRLNLFSKSGGLARQYYGSAVQPESCPHDRAHPPTTRSEVDRSRKC